MALGHRSPSLCALEGVVRHVVGALLLLLLVLQGNRTGSAQDGTAPMCPPAARAPWACARGLQENKLFSCTAPPSHPDARPSTPAAAAAAVPPSALMRLATTSLFPSARLRDGAPAFWCGGALCASNVAPRQHAPPATPLPPSHDSLHAVRRNPLRGHMRKSQRGVAACWHQPPPATVAAAHSLPRVARRHSRRPCPSCLHARRPAPPPPRARTQQRERAITRGAMGQELRESVLLRARRCDSGVCLQLDRLPRAAGGERAGCRSLITK